MDTADMVGSLRRALHDEPDLAWTIDHDCNQLRLDEEPECFAAAPSFTETKRKDAGGTAPDGANTPLSNPIRSTLDNTKPSKLWPSFRR